MYVPVVPSKTIPYSTPKWAKCFQTKKVQTPYPSIIEGSATLILTPFMIVTDQDKVQKWVKKIAFWSRSWFREPGGTPPPRIYRNIYNFDSCVLLAIFWSYFSLPRTNLHGFYQSSPQSVFYTQSAVRSPQSAVRSPCFILTAHIILWVKNTNKRYMEHA